MIKTHTPSLRRLFEAKTKELGRAIPVLKRGHKGKTRSQMPQIDNPIEFINWLKKVHGIPYSLERVPTGTMKPTQKHFDVEKVRGMVKSAMDGKFPKISDPVITSRDLRILDGHHRWAALRVMSPKNPMSVYRTSTTIEDLIRLARQYGARQEKLHKTAEGLESPMCILSQSFLRSALQ